jgi:hypothetical protein
MFEELKSLLHAGPAVQKPEPKPVVVATAPVAEAFEPEIIKAPEPEIVKAPAPAPIVAKIRIEPEIVPFSSVPVAPAAAPEAEKLHNALGIFRGTLHPDGTFSTATSEKFSADPFVNLSEEDRRPVDWEEEKRLDLPMRSAGRIQFLLQYETEAQRKARIANDHGRALNGKATVTRDIEKSAAAQSVNRWRI